MKKSKLPFKGKKFDQDEWLRESQKWQSTPQLPAEIKQELAKEGILEWVDAGMNSFINVDDDGNEFYSEEDIYEAKKHISQLASQEITLAKQQERERVKADLEPIRADLVKTIPIFAKHGMKETAREMRENVEYMVSILNGYTAEDAMRKALATKE